MWGCLVGALPATTLGVRCTVAGSRFGPSRRPSVSPSASVAPLAPRQPTAGQGAGPLAVAAPHRAAPVHHNGTLPAPRGGTAASVYGLDGVRGGHAGGSSAAEPAAKCSADCTSVAASRSEPGASPEAAGCTSAGTTSSRTTRRRRPAGASAAHAHDRRALAASSATARGKCGGAGPEATPLGYGGAEAAGASSVTADDGAPFGLAPAVEAAGISDANELL